MTDTKSPLVNPHALDLEGSPLQVHFYGLHSSPWWMRWFLRPKPLYSHCSVQWGSFIHNMTLTEGTGFHPAAAWHAANPPDLTLEIPFTVTFDEAGDLVRRFEKASVQRCRIFLWWSHIYRRRVPLSCASLVSAWLNVAMPMQPVYVGTPDELYWALVLTIGPHCISMIRFCEESHE